MSDKQIENNTEESPSHENNVINQSIGQMLKTARKSQNIEIEHVCNQLNLSSHVVEALESDNYEGLPEIAYVRGYIVSYCRLLGLDSFSVLKQLVTDEPSLSVSNSMTTNVKMDAGGQGTKVFKKLIPVIVLVLIGTAAFWFFTEKDKLLNNFTSNDQEKPVSTSVNGAEENNQTTQKNTENVSSVSDASVSVADNPSESTATDTLKETPEGSVDKTKESLLELEFNSVSWVDIQNTKKEKIVYQSFPRGEKHQVKTTLPLNIFIDNAAGVFMRYEGRLIDLKPYIQDGYAKFTLSE